MKDSAQSVGRSLVDAKLAYRRFVEGQNAMCYCQSIAVGQRAESVNPGTLQPSCTWLASVGLLRVLEVTVRSLVVLPRACAFEEAEEERTQTVGKVNHQGM